MDILDIFGSSSSSKVIMVDNITARIHQETTEELKLCIYNIHVRYYIVLLPNTY